MIASQWLGLPGEFFKGLPQLGQLRNFLLPLLYTFLKWGEMAEVERLFWDLEEDRRISGTTALMFLNF